MNSTSRTEEIISNTLTTLGDTLARAVDDPALFEDFVSQAMSAAGRDGALADARFEQMVRESLPALAFAIRAKQAALASYFEALTDSAVAIETSGTLAYANRTAREKLSLDPGSELSALGVGRAAFERFFRRLTGATEGCALLVGDILSDPVPHIWLGRSLPAYGVICLTPLSLRWPDRLSETLATEFGLSPREIAVLSSLAKGRSIEAIAVQDEKAVGTIRQSAKAILTKLGVKSQGQAVALVSAMAASIAPMAPEGPAILDDMELPSSYDRYGRLVARRRYGIKKGIPMLFVHGTLYGVGELAAERRLIRELGFDVLACERPGYGRTPPCGVRNDIVDTTVADMVLALDEAGMDRVVVLAHDTGFPFASALAIRAPERVAGIVAVSPVIPMRSDAQSDGMPAQQQIFAWAARRAPWLVDALTRIGVERMKRLGADGWPHAVFAGADRDKDVVTQSDVLGAVTAAYGFNAAQSALGFKLDVGVANSDWSDHAERLSCPVHLIHGTESRTVPPSAVQAFVARHPAFVLESIKGEGHTLPLAAPQLGLRAAFAMAVRSNLV